MTTLPSPNRPRPVAALEDLPIFSSLLDHPRLGVASWRMVDVMNHQMRRETRSQVAVTDIGLLHFFTALEAEQ